MLPHRPISTTLLPTADAMIQSRYASVSRPSGSEGFTLIELLAVIAIIGILAAILIPTVSAVRVSANKAKTKVQFNQWATAVEGFRSEYGYYPLLDASNRINPAGQNTDPAALHVFHDVLAAHRRNGDPLPAYGSGTGSGAPEAQNRKRIRFYSFGESDLAANSLLRDAFDNTEIAILVDHNLDGVIRINGTNADYAALPAVNGLTPTADDFSPAGVRAGVILYAPAPGATADEPKFIFSWK